MNFLFSLELQASSDASWEDSLDACENEIYGELVGLSLSWADNPFESFHL